MSLLTKKQNKTKKPQPHQPENQTPTPPTKKPQQKKT